MVAITVLSLMPLSLPKLSIFSWQDKVHHFVVYAGLCFLAIKAYGNSQPLWKIGMVLTMFGLAIEIAQSLTSYRLGEFMDLGANILGILAAIYVTLLFRKYFE
jgi:VanZ family protein